MKIGIPRTLTYYAYFPMWQKFFQELGCEILVSERTTKAILDQGVYYTVNDACIPIKIFHGHVCSLKDKVDFIFIPRLINLTGAKTETYCPKFLGLADMVHASIEGLPAILDFHIDMREKFKDRYKEFARIGHMLETSPMKVTKAFHKARKHMAEYRKLISGKADRTRALSLMCEKNDIPVPSPDALSLAVVGYPYLIYDNLLNANLIDKLIKMDIQILTPEMVPVREQKKQSRYLPKDLFWTFSNQVVRSALYYMDNQNIDGIIHITAFGCGPDAMVDKLVELEAKQRNIPFICVSVDEHTGEGGIHTRLEAFVDMLEYRRDMI